MRNDSLRHGTAAAWCGRLLLFAVLLFGVLTMHTFGHPAAHDGRAAAVTHVAPAVHVRHAPAPADGHGMPMHPASVCLAVLGSAGAAALGLFGALAAVVPRARRDGAGPPFPAGRLPGPAPRPPPAGRALLSRLSVLRV